MRFTVDWFSSFSRIESFPRMMKTNLFFLSFHLHLLSYFSDKKLHKIFIISKFLHQKKGVNVIFFQICFIGGLCVALSAVMAVGVCGGRTGARHHGAASVGSCHFVKAPGGVKGGAAAQYADGAFLLVDKLLKIPDPFAQHHHLFA